MGNSASSSSRGQHDETVDYGFLDPQGVYSGQPDWNTTIVSQLIVDRKLAPFYRPLEDYDNEWDDERILAARKDLPTSEGDTATIEAGPRVDQPKPQPTKRSSNLKEVGTTQEAAVYRGAVECPICFLYYPPNINRSRCCDQAICTECFVQIKRNEPTVTHLVSEPAACPYCVQDNFGVTYTPPLWRAGIGSENFHNPSHPGSPRSLSHQSEESTEIKGRRKSLNHDNQNVVTIDQIRPDWEAKLAAVRAAVARRANRRIIMRQVGDRLIPVGVTSGRVHTLPEGAISGEQGESVEGSNEGRGSRRSRRRQQQQQELNQLLGSMGLGGQDLEELMVMEAMRLSLLEHEEQQRREAQKKDGDAENQSRPNNNVESNSILSSPKPNLPPIPNTSLDASPRPSISSETPLPSSLPANSEVSQANFKGHNHTPSISSPLGAINITAPDSEPNNITVLPASNIVPAIEPQGEVGVGTASSQSAVNTTSNNISETPNPSTVNGHTPIPTSSLSPSSSMNIKPNFSTLRQDSSWSSVFSDDTVQTTPAYDVLLSSPDSEISHLPLLRETPSDENTEERQVT